MVEWSTLETVAKFFGYASSILVLLLAVYGVDSWRREHPGKRRIELAEDTLALFYEGGGRDSAYTPPFSTGSESADLERGPRETDAQFRARQNASVAFHRHNQHSELFSRLHAMRYRFMAQVGKAEAAPFDELRDVVSEIFDRCTYAREALGAIRRTQATCSTAACIRPYSAPGFAASVFTICGTRSAAT